jgi:hypothetical protein
MTKASDFHAKHQLEIELTEIRKVDVTYNKN